MKIWLVTLSFLLCSLTLKAQLPQLIADSSRMQISLLTCTPGKELYATFGHSAIRVIDSNSVTDLVYNYGTFDFNDPNFYTKFVKGQLNYYLSVEYFTNFKFDYQAENRGITEQILNLSAADKIKLRIDGVIELHYKGSLKFIYKLEEGELFISEWDFAELTKEK